MSKLSIGVYQSGEIGTAYDGTGFYSARGSSGSFTYQFERPGVYYFSSGTIDVAKRITMGGRVVVSSLKTLVRDVKLKINSKYKVVWCESIF